MREAPLSHGERGWGRGNGLATIMLLGIVAMSDPMNVAPATLDAPLSRGETLDAPLSRGERGGGSGNGLATIMLLGIVAMSVTR
jgi:hypothetical protein